VSDRPVATEPRRRRTDAALPPPAPTPPRKRRRLDVGMEIVRMVAVAGMMVAVAVAAGNVFDRFEWSLLVPVATAFGAVLAGRWLPARLRAAISVALAVVAVAGGAVLVALIAGGTLSDAIPGVVEGPRRVLTTEWPSPTDPTVLATLAVLIGAATAIALDLARRTRLHLAPLGPVLACFVAVIASSAPVRPNWWLVGVLGVGAVALGLARHGERAATRVATLRGEVAVPIGLVAVAAAALAASGAVAFAGRADPRAVTEPQRSASLLRPLEETVGLRQADPPIDLFTVTDESPLIGQRMPVHWRTAALDTYDGQRWVPRVTVRPIGGQLGHESPAGGGRPDTVRYAIELLTERIDLVPLPGRPLELATDPALPIETDVDRIVVRLAAPAPVGTRLTLVAELAPTVGDISPAAIVPREVDEIAAGFTPIAAELAGQGDPLTRLQRLEHELRSWQRDPAAPGSGQQLFLIERFVDDTRRGTPEQFVTAFVLLARSLGFDARVATGFAVDPTEAVSPLTVRSQHAAAWPEVNIADIGWLAFDPVPPTEAVGDDEPEPPQEAQTPAAAQPPVDPPAERGPDEEPEEEPAEETAEGWGVGAWIVRVTFAVGLTLLPFALAIGAILALKYARRQRRVRLADPAGRVRGAWANTTDALVDAGLLIEPSWTDDRIAAMGAPLVGNVPHELRRLAGLATAATFGPPVSPEVGADAHATERALETAIAERLTWWQRVRWRLSLRSLRPATRSPVVA